MSTSYMPVARAAVVNPWPKYETDWQRWERHVAEVVEELAYCWEASRPMPAERYSPQNYCLLSHAPRSVQRRLAAWRNRPPVIVAYTDASGLAEKRWLKQWLEARRQQAHAALDRMITWRRG